jgi:actin-related protein 4
MEIHNPHNPETGIVEDFDRAAKLWEYAFVSRILDPRPTPPQNNGLNEATEGEMEDVVENKERQLCANPVLMSEPAWNPTKNREKTMELVFEDWGLNAFYLAREGVLAGFGHGKAQALVIDVGASNVSVTPVYDGIVMKKGVFHSPLAGNFVSDQIRMMLQNMNIDASPHYMYNFPKIRVDANEPPQTPLRVFDVQPTDSFRRLQQEAWVLKEFKEIVAQVYPGPGPLNETVVNSQPGRPFEFPSGYNQVFGAERFRPAEALFDASAALTVSSSPALPSSRHSLTQSRQDDTHPAPKPEQTIPALVKASLNAVDVESRPNLLNNIVVVGGTSLLHGFTDRLQSELMTAFPSPRIRIQASGQTADRLYAPWVGGSILSSVGTFHQMWVSKKEYEEHGASIVEKRCK